MAKKKRYWLKKKGQKDDSSSISGRGSPKKARKPAEEETVRETARLGHYVYEVERGQSQTERFQSANEKSRRPELAAAGSNSQRLARKNLSWRHTARMSYSKVPETVAEFAGQPESSAPARKLIKLFFADPSSSTTARLPGRPRRDLESVGARLTQHVAAEYMRQDFPILAGKHLLSAGSLQI